MDGFWSELMRRGYSMLSGEKLFRVACQIRLSTRFSGSILASDAPGRGECLNNRA